MKERKKKEYNFLFSGKVDKTFLSFTDRLYNIIISYTH